jgi:ATP-dependent Lhr-like helicase
MPLSGFDPLVAEWFEGRFGRPTEPQVHGWPEIRSGRDVLISAPTGSGKTLAAFLLCLDGLIRRARSGELPNETIAVYVSPLKALSNDIRKNLETPLGEIFELAARKGISLAPIRTAVRTGDTKVWERQQMAAKPPHILVTTPESLFILLTARRGREALRTVRTVIVDEIHAVADDKRGSHLALSLERLEWVAACRPGGAENGRRLQRIGLSATVKPIDEVARFLSRKFDPPSTSVRPQANGAAGHIVQIGHHRAMELAVEVPKDELGVVATNEMWEEIYDRLAALIRENRTTLLFVNTRRLAERVTHHLQERLGPDVVLPHHGSLSRKLRLTAEEKLKNGELRAVVATASLELGIDIGTVDLVCQVGSPRSIAVALQRFGRSGHWVGATPKARLFATTRDELVECAALIRSIHEGELDRLEIPDSPLDVLAQQIIAETACEEWGEDELFERFRSTYAYRGLTRQRFDSVVEMLSEGISSARGRSAAYLHRDQVNHRLRGRRNARLAAITSGGAIPDTAQYRVVAEPEGSTVGSVDEDFAVESMAGDVFLLGTTSWRIRRIESGVVRVEDAHGAAPTIPFWRGEAPGRTIELSREVSRLREDVTAWLDRRAAGQPAVSSPPATGGQLPSELPALPDFLLEDCRLDRRGAEQAVEYIQAGRKALGVMPSQQTVVAERFFDESGGMQLILHAPFGSRINRAWGLALRKRFCRSFNLELQAAATDNGINISLTEQHAFPLEMVFEFLRPATLDHVLTQALLASPMFTARWRWNLSRALAVLRFAGGRKVPPPLQRMRAEDLLAAVFPDQAACAENLSGEIRIPDHPLVNETIDNCLHEAMDLEGLRQVIEGILSGTIRSEARETAEPSPFSHEILNANPYAFLDDAPLEERRARAVQMRRSLGGDLVDGFAALDPEAIAQIEDEVWPLVRDADELHDALLTLGTVPPRPEWEGFFASLVESGRATVLGVAAPDLEGTRSGLGRPEPCPTFWVAAERVVLAQQLHPGAECWPAVAAVPSSKPLPDSRQAGVTEVLRGWLDSTGPATVAELAERLALPDDLIRQALLQLESEGQVLRGRFRPSRGAPPTGATASATAATEATTGSSASAASAGDSHPHQPDAVEWCNRRVLARIHRLTLGRLRREIQPVSTADFMRFLCRWQHAAPAGRLHGVDGTLQVIRQLQGYEIPAAAWEAEILPRRVAGYKPDLLDRLCLSGEVVWGRLSPHPAFGPPPQENDSRNPVPGVRRRGAAALPGGSVAAKNGESDGESPTETTRRRRVRPTRAAPISLFLREDAPYLLAEAKAAAEDPALGGRWMSRADGRASGAVAPRNGGLLATPPHAAERGTHRRGDDSPRAENMTGNGSSLESSLTHPAREVLAALQSRGASFFADLVRATRRLPSEVEDGLWELVAAGLVTADGFENLRALVDPKRRRGEGRGRTARPRHAAGRWALLAEVLGSDQSAAGDTAEGDRFSRAVGSQEAADSQQARTAVTVPARAHSSLENNEELDPLLEENIEEAEVHPAAKPPATPVEAFARQVLARWGVVFRDILQRETLAPPWRDLLLVLRRMEARGEIRGGRFVEAFRGEQFALPEAVEALRAVRRAEPAGEEIAISAADPLNLAGIILPGPRLSAAAGVTVRLRDGVLVEQPGAAMLSQAGESTYTHPQPSTAA